MAKLPWRHKRTDTCLLKNQDAWGVIVMCWPAGLVPHLLTSTWGVGWPDRSLTHWLLPCPINSCFFLFLCFTKTQLLHDAIACDYLNTVYTYLRGSKQSRRHEPPSQPVSELGPGSGLTLFHDLGNTIHQISTALDSASSCLLFMH